MKGKISYKEYRCVHCKKLLFKGILIESAVQVKCKRCLAMNEFVGENKDAYMCLIANCPHRVTAHQTI